MRYGPLSRKYLPALFLAGAALYSQREAIPSYSERQEVMEVSQTSEESHVLPNMVGPLVLLLGLSVVAASRLEERLSNKGKQHRQY